MEDRRKVWAYAAWEGGRTASGDNAREGGGNAAGVATRESGGNAAGVASQEDGGNAAGVAPREDSGNTAGVATRKAAETLQVSPLGRNVRSGRIRRMLYKKNLHVWVRDSLTARSGVSVCVARSEARLVGVQHVQWFLKEMGGVIPDGSSEWWRGPERVSLVVG